MAYTENYGGFWILSGYTEIKEVAGDDIRFSSAQGLTIPDKANRGQRSIPAEMDPPDFLAFRRILHPMLSPSAVERLTPVIERFAHAAIDEFIESGECDFVHDLADPLPAMTTLYKLGLPVERWKEFSEPLHRAVFLRQDNPERADVVEHLRAIGEVLYETIAARRESPRDDMISYLLGCSVDGRPVTDDEVKEMAYLVIQGGFDTTGSAISNALIQLHHDRGARRRLIDDPGLMTSAIEEFLRLEAPQLALARTANVDCEIGGHQISAGDKLLLVWASGNRDADVFDNPDELQLDRFPNRHMTFGLGAHRCLGSNLARRQIEIALQAVLQRLPDYEIDLDAATRPQTVGIAYGMYALPARFTPAPRWYRQTESLR
ncbi:cytochrome P450 [Candidatus Poriferisocius sp.]|uniref:cytochrome P450 n=1 Tax=Candidatus Poriferisocius sp. TaxID=3101276 RepID=UPI003B594AAC